jgi:hypothetical protein
MHSGTHLLVCSKAHVRSKLNDAVLHSNLITEQLADTPVASHACALAGCSGPTAGPDASLS